MHFAVPTLRERLQALHFTVLGLSEGQNRQILEYKIVKYKTRALPRGDAHSRNSTLSISTRHS